jgi:SAM-dependent methyltransferase
MAHELQITGGEVSDFSLDLTAELDAYNQWVFDLLRPHVQGRVLEIGCGTGNISAFLADAAEQVVGIDPAGHLVAECQRRFAGADQVTIRQCTMQTMPLPSDEHALFDAAVSCNVFEHIDDDVGTMALARRHLRPGGKLVLYVPACPMAFGELDRAFGHYRRYTLRSLRRAMEAAGLRWAGGQYTNRLGLPGWFVNSVILRKQSLPAGQARIFNRMVGLARLLDRMLPLPIGQSVVGVGVNPDACPLAAPHRRAA